MKWKHRYSLLLPLVIILFVISFNSVAACLCILQHPQTHFCQADFVAVVRTWKQIRVSPYEIAYKVKVNKIFKNVAEGGIKLGYEKLYTAAEDNFCGATLDAAETYIVSGRIVSGKASISLCSMTLPWSQVTSRQRKGFREFYKRGCECKILFTDWLEKGTILDKAGNSSCLWEGSPGPQDCQDKYGICMRTSSGSCSWAPSVPYKNCIKEYRELRHQRP